MIKVIECVPNFSEGRNQETITAITDAIEQTSGCRLLDVDPGRSTNRTVYTFVGSPDAVLAGALNAAKAARERIDMTVHKGEHPRMGAMDVCPFIPVANVTMEECVEISKEFGRQMAQTLDVPVYLYEESSSCEYRKKLPQIRQGEYEAIKNRITQKKWQPDFGPARFVPQWGATVTGARSFLIAYNVNLLSTPNQAHRIALNLREAGRGPDEPGQLKEVKGMGWYVDEYNLAQVTVNLNDYNITPIHTLFEAVREEAKKLNVAVAGSEIVGVVPLEAMLLAAEYYIEKENLFILDEDQKIRLVIERLGLNAVADFNPKEKIIEYIIREERDEPLAGLSLRQFIQAVSARSAAPGGGSTAAAMAAMGVGLGAMAAKLTLGVRRFESVDDNMRQIVPILHHTALDLIPMIDADTNAFNAYIDAIGLPKETQQEKEVRHQAMQEGLKQAVHIPMTTMEKGDHAWDAMIQTARYANIASRSDIEVGAKALEAGIWGAYKNVMINMDDIDDQTYKTKVTAHAQKICKKAQDKYQEVIDILQQRKGQVQ